MQWCDAQPATFPCLTKAGLGLHAQTFAVLPAFLPKIVPISCIFTCTTSPVCVVPPPRIHSGSHFWVCCHFFQASDRKYVRYEYEYERGWQIFFQKMRESANGPGGGGQGGGICGVLILSLFHIFSAYFFPFFWPKSAYFAYFLLVWYLLGKYVAGNQFLAL